MLRAHAAPRAPHGAVALEAAAESQLPHAVAALHALRGALPRSTSGDVQKFHMLGDHCCARSPPLMPPHSALAQLPHASPARCCWLLSVFACFCMPVW